MTGLYALIFAGACLASGLLTWILCRLAPVLGLVDHPQGRKSHAASTPVVGGLAIMIGSLLALVAIMASGGRAGVLMGEVHEHGGFLIGAAVLILMGVIDDWRPIAARYKLLLQLICCVLAVFVDQVMVGDVGVSLFGRSYNLGPLVGPFSVLVMLTITNAMNMIDGVDGLAGGITFCALLIMSKAAATAGFTSASYLIALVGGLAGFLAFNFPVFPGQRAKAFLGDSGSLAFGFALGYMAIDLSAMPGRLFKPSTALFLFFIPVADTIWIYMRRMWVARAPFAAGRDHIHHLVMERFSPRITTWILVGVSGFLSAAAYFAERKGVPNWVMILTWIGLFLAYGALTQRAWRNAWNRSRKVDEAPAG